MREDVPGRENFVRIVGVSGQIPLPLPHIEGIDVLRLRTHIGVLENARGIRSAHGEREKQQLDRDETVAGFLGQFLRRIQYACGIGREINLACA